MRRIDNGDARVVGVCRRNEEEFGGSNVPVNNNILTVVSGVSNERQCF